ncbi:DUF4190 domain-containing protein [Streptomyces sp. NPDC002054]|uniref:DUF4190 domain-containing protein n=1 Tax=Streptomyces sp. NPDC002054 TaxID=3154663 RepID=UPI0033170F34
MERNESTGIGTAAAVLGALGLMALVLTPVLLPAVLAAPPLGIAAVVCGAVARSRAQRSLATTTGPANVGIGLGITAFTVPVLFLAFAAWVLHEAYDTDGDSDNGHKPSEYVAPERTPVSWSAAPKPGQQHPGRIVYQDGVEITVHSPQAVTPGPEGKQAYRVLISISSPGDHRRPLDGPVLHFYDRTGGALNPTPDCPDKIPAGQRMDCLNTVYAPQGTPWLELSIIPSFNGYDPANLRLPIGT